MINFTPLWLVDLLVNVTIFDCTLEFNMNKFIINISMYSNYLF